MRHGRARGVVVLCCSASLASACIGSDQAPPDTSPPTPPSALAATGYAHRVVLAWSGATDDRAVTRYRVARGGAPLGETRGAQYADGGLAENTEYCYEVRALDAAGNASEPIGVCTVTAIDLGADWTWPSQVASDGQWLWIPNYEMGTGTPQEIRAYDPSTGARVRAIPAPSSWTSAPCLVDGGLWVVDWVDGITALRLDPATGAILQSLPLQDPAGEPRGLAWDGARLYYAGAKFVSMGAWVPSTIVELDLATGAAARVVYVTSAWEIDGLTFADGSLWFLGHAADLVAADRIVRVSTAGVEEGSVELPSTGPPTHGVGGLAFVGVDAWFVRRSFDSSWFELARIPR